MIIESSDNKDTTERKIRTAIIIVSAVNLLYLGAMALIFFASIFFYRQFAFYAGSPYNAILNINPIYVRIIMSAGLLVSACASAGCILMIRLKRTGFWIFAIPVFLIIAISLFVVFNAMNIIQLLLLILSLVVLSSLFKYKK